MPTSSPQQHLCGLQFQRFRRARGRIIADQAKALNVSVSFISSIEANTIEMPAWYIDKFAHWLKLSPSETDDLRIKIGEIMSINQNSFGSVRKLIPQTTKGIRALRLHSGGAK